MRQKLNPLIFNRLEVDVDESGARVVQDTITEPLASFVYLRRDRGLPEHATTRTGSTEVVPPRVVALIKWLYAHPLRGSSSSDLAEVILRYANFSIPVPAREMGPTPVGLHGQASGAGPLRLSADDGPPEREWRLLEAQKVTARALAKTGSSPNAIARATGASETAVRALLANELRDREPFRAPSVKMTQEQVREAAKLRALGWTYHKLGWRYNVNRTTVRNRLRSDEV